MLIDNDDNPTLYKAVNYVIQQSIAQLNIGVPGSVVSFEEKSQMAEVQIEVSQLYEDGESLIIPPIFNVPIERVRSNEGDSYIILPIKSGDKGWIKFSQRTIDDWINSGKQQSMTSLKMFDLSDAVFVPGLYPTSRAITENNTDVVIRNKGSRHIIGEDSHEVNTESGGYAKISEDKITIGNSSGEVLDLLDRLLSQLLISYGVSPTGPAPLDPTSVAEITLIQQTLSLIKGTP